MDDTTIARMRRRAAQMRRAASLSHNPEILELLTRAAAEAEADAAKLEAELHPQMKQQLPPQS